MQVTIPVGASAVVALPTAVLGAVGNGGSLRVSEGGGRVVFCHGQYVPGVAGVISATFVHGGPATTSRIDVAIGSGSYDFVLSHREASGC